MPKRESKSLPPRKEIAQLQESLLRAALLNQPLPGGQRPIRLPDAAFILRHPNIYLSEENLAGPISIEGLPKPLRVMSQKELQKEASEQGDVAYLHFPPPERVDDAVRLTLEGKLATQNPDQQTLGLSSIQVKFREVDGRWQSVDDPVSLAS